MKKIIISCVILTALFFAVSCGAEEQDSFGLDFNMNSGEQIDLEGYKCVYYFNPELNWAVDTVSESYLGFDLNSVFADAARERIADVQKSLNCKIEIIYRDELHTFVKPALVSGTYVGDILSGISDMWGDYCRLGVFIGMSELSDYIDITNEAKWGNRAFLETMYYENDLYGVVPNAWPELTYTNFGYPIVFNANLTAVLGQTDPREYVENNQWDWNRFCQCLVDFTYTEGGTTKYYGFATQRRVLADMFIFSNGSNLVVDKGNGKYEFGLYDTRGMKAIDMAKNIVFGEYKDCISQKSLSDNFDKIAMSFANDECVMAAVYTGYLYGRDAIVGLKSDNFGILTWPHGPDVPDDFTFSVVENIYSGIAIPVTTKSPEATAMILNAIYEPLEGFESREVITEYMTKYYFFEERDAKAFFKMYDNPIYNYFHWFNGTGSLYVSYLSSSESSEEFVSAYESAVLENFEKNIIPIANGIAAVHGSYNYYD